MIVRLFFISLVVVLFLLTSCDSELSTSSSEGFTSTDGSSTTKYQIQVNVGNNDQHILDSDLKNAEQSVNNYLINNEPTKLGYTFSGWYLNGTLTEALDVNSFLSSYSSTNVNKNRVIQFVLYAKWTINKYTVTFKKNNGENDINHNVNHGNVINSITPVRTGYNFAGWYTESGLVNVYDFSTKVTAKLILYAKWAINTYTVTFQTGDEIAKTETVNYNTRVNSYSLAKYPYSSSSDWYTDIAFTTRYNFNNVVTSALTLYLKPGTLSTSSADCKEDAAGITYGNGKFYVSSKKSVHLFEYPGNRISRGSQTQKVTSGYTLNTQRSRGVEYYNGFLYLINSGDNKIYVFNATTFAQDTSKTITLDAANDNADDLVIHDGYFYVVEGADKKVYAYSAMDGSRASSKDFTVNNVSGSDTHPSAGLNPFGICYADGHFYVAYAYRAKVHAFRADTKALVPSRSFNLVSPNSNPQGMFYKNGAFYITDTLGDKIYIYKK